MHDVRSLRPHRAPRTTGAAATLLAAALLLTGLGACGGPTPPPSNVSTDPARAVSAEVGRDGGELETTAADGTRYRLEVPPGALLARTTITMVPVTAIADFPAAAGVAAGVDLGPDGLTLFEPAILTVEPNAGVDGLVGFAYQGDGEGLHLEPSFADGGVATFRLSSFSGYGLGAFTLAEIQSLPVPSDAGAAARQALALLVAGGDDLDAEAVALILLVWYVDGLAPLLALAEVDPGVSDAVYLRAETEFLQWSDALFSFDLYFAPPVLGDLLASERDAARSSLAAALRRGFEVHNDACLATADAATALGHAYQAARFALAATSLNLDEPALFLDRDYLWSQYCLTVAIDTVDFPDTLRPGDTGVLELTGAYRLGDGPVSFDPPLRYRVAFQGGGGFADLTGTANAFGAYVVDVTWPALADTLTLLVEACFDWEGGLVLSDADVCTETTIERTPAEEEEPSLTVFASANGVVNAYLNVSSNPPATPYSVLDQDSASLGPPNPGSFDLDLSASGSGSAAGAAGSSQATVVGDAGVVVGADGATFTMSVEVFARGSMSSTPPSDEAAVVGFGSASGGMTVVIEGTSASYTLNVSITYDAPLAPSSDGASVGLSGLVDERDIRSSRVVTSSGILPPGTYSFGAELVAEAGFYANPSPDYGDLFNWPETLNATMEVTFSVSQ
ncbi:MAG: hypothetical protein EA416_07385 [Trueperaceae bacterium]|nr:MAG: hypothetical protein EA416_07385 [Trueperaceae bacterium]